jgi:hypothetical protein
MGLLGAFAGDQGDCRSEKQRQTADLKKPELNKPEFKEPGFDGP